LWSAYVENKQKLIKEKKKLVILVLQCNEIDCLNNGTCVTLSTGYYRCNCAPSYGGIYCQYNITGCVFPFVDNQNRTHNTCITTSDYLGGTVPWCRNALGQPRSCASMNMIIYYLNFILFKF